MPVPAGGLGGQSLHEDPEQGSGKGVSDDRGGPCPSLGGLPGRGRVSRLPPWPSGAPRARSQLPPWAFRGRKAKEEKLFPFPDQSKHRPPLPAPAHARAPTLFSPKRLPAAPVHAHPAPYFSQGSQ